MTPRAKEKKERMHASKKGSIREKKGKRSKMGGIDWCKAGERWSQGLFEERWREWIVFWLG